MTSQAFRRIVVTGVECSGKTTLSQLLSAHLGWAWVPEAARTHPDVLANRIAENTFDALHELQSDAAAKARAEGAKGVVCDTGDLVLRLWSEAVLDFSWHPLLPSNPSVDLHILCPALEVWEADPLRTLPRLEDRLALESQFRAHLKHRPHLVAEGSTPEERLSHVMKMWPW